MCWSLAISCLVAKGDGIHSDLGVPLFLSSERSHGHIMPLPLSMAKSVEQDSVHQGSPPYMPVL